MYTKRVRTYTKCERKYTKCVRTYTKRVRTYTKDTCQASSMDSAKVLRKFGWKGLEMYLSTHICVTHLSHTTGHGLGRQEQGMLEPLKASMKSGRGGVGCDFPC